MINKIRPCFKKCLNINETPYLQVQNSSSVYISFSLEYIVGGRSTTKKSPVFGPGQTQRLTFPVNSSSRFFEVYNNYYYPAILICHRNIVSSESVFYQVINKLGTLQCIQVGYNYC